MVPCQDKKRNIVAVIEEKNANFDNSFERKE
jgi:hypothetical protein